MKPWWALSVALVGLTGCGRLDQLEYDPPVTPGQWCDERPCVEIGSHVLNEPLGTALVFGLALLWVAVGVSFLVTRRGQRSRVWLGVALVLGGLGAALAGVSYQAFSYELKCAGREVCGYTNGFEVAYNLTQACSVSTMLVAVAWACSAGRVRTGVMVYSAVNVVVYCAVTVIGVLAPSKSLLSFEVLMLFALPGIVIVLVLAARRHRASRVPMARAIMVAALALVVVNIAYFAYYLAGLTERLWDGGAGFYFSANDVLHLGMILWLVYVSRSLGPTLSDRAALPAGSRQDSRA